MNPIDIEINCGVEIEAEFNTDFINPEIAPYHSENREGECDCGDESCDYCSDYIRDCYHGVFRVEEDGSLCPQHFNCAEVAEFISPMFNIERADEIIKGFKEATIVRSGTKVMSKVFNFNSTTGAHVHFSVNARRKRKGRVGRMPSLKPIPLKILAPEDFLEFNNNLLTEIEKAFPKSKFNKFKKAFYRSYASEILTLGHSSSINFEPSGINHIELRSFNLRHCSTWADFEKSYLIFFRVLKEFIYNLIVEGVLVKQDEYGSLKYEDIYVINTLREVEGNLNFDIMNETEEEVIICAT